jgi:hypothetical protein
MLIMSTKIYIISLIALTILSGCSQKSAQVVELNTWTIDGQEKIIAQTGVEFDPAVSSDGNGALRIVAAEPSTIRLFELGDIDIENAKLFYRARLKTENVEGTAYLEMWCDFIGKGEFFSRDLQSPLTGTNDWSTEETFFFLQKGENPDNIKLNLVIDGKGIVWIDDIHLLKGPLN